MNSQNLPINWFDFAVIVVLLLGINKGRKHGMSQEMMVCLQWITIVLAGGFFYRPVGELLAQTSSVFGKLSCYIAAYIGIGLVVKIIFLLIKKWMGGKLVGSNIFGRSEYYLGMFAGAIRFTCILLAAVALLNARYYTPQEINRAVAFQNDVYGSTFFPELYSVQGGVFKESLVGKIIKDQASFLLIAPTSPENKGIKRQKDFPLP
ncbi:MAG: Colicin production protein [Pedosphaera sp.]|nr:Colicin production protein [Pedosphaera sp.]